MLREKTRILAQLKKQRETAPGRFWGLVAGTLVSSFGMVAAVAVAPGQDLGRLPQERLVEQLALPSLQIAQQDDHPFLREERVRAGDTLAGLLRRMGVSDTAALVRVGQLPFTGGLATAFRPGAFATVATSPEGRLLSASFAAPGSSSAWLIEARDGKLEVVQRELELERRIHTQSAVIRSTLFAATDAAGLPDSTTETLARMFEGEIDFHTGLKPGDRFTVIYEVLYHRGNAVQTGRILAAEFVNRGVRHSAFLFRHADGREEYFSRDGKSLKDGFLRSPLEYSRISSGFSMRLHPVFGEWRAHNGTDFAAPVGTPVRATADGLVDFVGVQNGYGNFVVLRHQDRYTTAYGHLNGFVSGLRKGERIRQGQIIGFVGRTGWATGPHLHYEFRINDVPQNPETVALPNAAPLTHHTLAAFRDRTAPLVARLDLAQQQPGNATAMLD